MAKTGDTVEKLIICVRNHKKYGFSQVYYDSKHQHSSMVG